jgi:hypothetical protein
MGRQLNKRWWVGIILGAVFLVLWLMNEAITVVPASYGAHEQWVISAILLFLCGFSLGIGLTLWLARGARPSRDA